MECYKIFSNPIIKLLLKNEATIFGPFIRKMLFQDMSFIKFISSENPRIGCFCKEVYRDIVERDLNDYLIKIYKKKKNTYRNEYTSYKLKYKGLNFFLDVNYVKNSLDFYMKYYTRELGLYLDIDCVYIDRLGMGMLDFSELYQTEPVPIHKIIGNIRNKKYNVLIKDDLMNVSFLEHIKPLVENGWKNFKRETATPKDIEINPKCDICRDEQDSTSIMLECGHIFHYKCIAKYLEVVIKDVNDVARCPYCQSRLYMNEIL